MRGPISEIIVGTLSNPNAVAKRLTALADEVERLGLLGASMEIRRAGLYLKMEARGGWKERENGARLDLTAKA